MKRTAWFLTSLLLVGLMHPACEAHRVHKRPLVQMAILLDTSNSMDGLIEQAKSQLWRITNDFAYSSQYGQRPTLQIALYEYGNSGLSPRAGYIRQVLAFTTDVDRVSERLFALRTNGGDEYCGAVIRDAVEDLDWDPDPDVYKVIFVAGNEPFTQGPVYFRDAIAKAQRRGITVNTIFCGNHAEGVRGQWSDGALAGHGVYLTIDHHQAIVIDPTPYDPEISRLGAQINDTFVVYGAAGRAEEKSRRMADQAAVAMAPAGAVAERAIYKGSMQYSMGSADIVAQVASGQRKAAELKPSELPATLSAKSAPELETYLKDQQQKRTALQTRMEELKKSRDEYLAQRAKDGGKGASLDQAIREAVREQAGRFHFTFGPSKS